MRYKEDYTDEFIRRAKKLKKKNKTLMDQLDKKIDEILNNPEHYKPLKYDHKGKRRTHIGSFVVVFEIKEGVVIFHSFKHHDFAY